MGIIDFDASKSAARRGCFSMWCAGRLATKKCCMNISRICGTAASGSGAMVSYWPSSKS